MEHALDLSEQLAGSDYTELGGLVKQINGASRIAQLRGLERLTAEMLACMENDASVPLDAEACKKLFIDSITSALSFAETVVKTRQENACVLLPEITALRRLRGRPPLYEYQLLDDIAWPSFDKEVSTNPLAGNQREDVKRLLHLYQFALLDVIRDNNRKKALVIMYRVAERLQSIALLEAEKDYWWVLGVTVRGLAESKLEFQTERIRLLAAVEKQLRLLSTDTPCAERNPYPEGLWRAFISLAALIESLDEQEKIRRQSVGIPDLKFTESQVMAIRRVMAGQTEEDPEAMVKALASLITSTRGLLDSTQIEGSDSGTKNIKELQEAFEDLAEQWSQAGFDGLSRRFRQFSARLQSSRPDSQLPIEMISEFIDAVLQCECALADFDHKLPGKDEAEAWEKQPLSSILQASLLKTAQLTVMDESSGQLNEVKEMISSIASGYAAEELLPEVESAFKVICGSAQIMGLCRLAEQAERCLAFIKQAISPDGTTPLIENHWEIFADSIACLEYYIDSCKLSGKADEAPLDIAGECLVTLGV